MTAEWFEGLGVSDLLETEVEVETRAILPGGAPVVATLRGRIAEVPATVPLSGDSTVRIEFEDAERPISNSPDTARPVPLSDVTPAEPTPTPTRHNE